MGKPFATTAGPTLLMIFKAVGPAERLQEYQHTEVRSETVNLPRGGDRHSRSCTECNDSEDNSGRRLNHDERGDRSNDGLSGEER
jgi:hypothetical protein